MTVDAFVEEVETYWSWLRDAYISRLYDRQWTQWEMLAAAGILSVLLLWKIRRRRRKAAARKRYTEGAVADPAMVGVKLAAADRIRGNGEELRRADEAAGMQVQREYQRWTTAGDESLWRDQPIRDLRREIIKRDQREARLEREIAALRDANEQLEHEVAGLMAVNERLLRQAGESRRSEELSRR